MEPDVARGAAIGSTSRRRFVLTMIVAVLLISGISAVSWIAAKRTQTDADLIAHTYAVKQALEATMRHLIDVENAVRGFSLTGDDRFLEPITTGRQTLSDDVAVLRQLTSDNSTQQRQLDALEPRIDDALRFGEALVAERRTTGVVPETRLVRENNRIINGTRTAVRRMQAEEDRLLMERTRESNAARRTTTAVSIAGAAVGLILLIAIGYATHREIRTSVLNTELERRIENRTAALRAESDERWKAEERLRLAITGAGLGTWHWDLVNSELVWSAECLALFGLPPDTTMTYERFLAAVHPDDRDRTDEAVRRSLDSRSEFNIELRAICPDGSVRHIVSMGRGYYDAAGRAMRMEGIAQDVSERRRVSDALQQQARELIEQAALLDHAFDPVLVWNLDDRVITYCNTAAEQLYGFTRAEAVGRRVHELLGGSLPVGDDALAALRTDGRWEGTITHTTKDHRQIVVDTRMAAFQVEGGATRVLQASRDVTEQKQTGQALRASESRFRQLAESTPAMIWQVGHDGSFTYMNQRLRDYLGSETLTLADWRDAIHPDDRPAGTVFMQTARTQRRLMCEELRVRRYDGEYRWFYVQIAPILNSDGMPACWIGTATDIDELKRTQHALVETNQRKDVFLATLAHELRNPLAPIRFALDRLKAETAPPDSKHARDVIERQVTQLVRLVEDLLDVSRITTNKIRLRREPVRLADLMETAVQGASPLAHAAEQRLDVELPPPTVWINGDAARLVQVFSNVLNNAVKFTPRRGHISFTAKALGEDVIVQLRDTGIGIAPEALPHLFEMFHQEGNILERSTGGLGIGLTLAHRLIEMHDGRIEVRSRGVGEGTEVEIRLPTTTPRQVPAGEPGHTADGRRSRPLRVQIVDDNVDAAEMLGVLVSGLGHTTELAHDGPTALRLAETFAPDVILLDIGLPMMNGYAVAQELRRRPAFRSVHLAALTGWGQAEDRRRAREAGFDTHFTKPVATTAVEELLSAIARGEQFAGPASGRPRTRFGDTSVM
jgi:PAS domain S-box-containing protein